MPMYISFPVAPALVYNSNFVFRPLVSTGPPFVELPYPSILCPSVAEIHATVPLRPSLRWLLSCLISVLVSYFMVPCSRLSGMFFNAYVKLVFKASPYVAVPLCIV